MMDIPTVVVVAMLPSKLGDASDATISRSTPDAFDPRPLADSASDQINGDLPSLRGAKLSGMCAIDFGAGLRNSFG